LDRRRSMLGADARQESNVAIVRRFIDGAVY
jgi:hypothetical protein